MKKFLALFNFEFKRIFTRVNIIVFLILGILSIYFIQDGITEYKIILNNKSKFQEIENKRIESYTNYTQYGGYGFRLLFLPSPMTVFFTNASLINEVNAQINSGDLLRIYFPYEGKNLFLGQKGFTDLGGLFLLVGTLLSLFLGYDSQKSKEFIRVILRVIEWKRYLFFLLLAKIVFIFFYLTGIAGIGLLLLKLNSLSLSRSEQLQFMIFFVTSLLLFSIFVIVGFIAGCSKKKMAGIFAIFFIWFSLIFVIPETIQKITYSSANSIESNFDLEMKKFKVLMDFESKALDEAQRYPNMEVRKESERRLIEGYWNNELQQIFQFENQMQKRMKDNLRKYEFISMVFPTTYFTSIKNEISSCGYHNFFGFYDFIKNLKIKFVRFYFDKKFYSNYSDIEPFIKGDQNIFYAESRLPGNFKTGLAINLFYLVVLIGLAYFRFFQYVFGVPNRKMPELSELNPKLNPGQILGLVTEDDVLKTQIYRLWSGKFGKLAHVDAKVGEESVFDPKYKDKGFDFLYICHVRDLPEDIKTKDFVEFLLRIQGASKRDRSRLFLELELDKHEGKKLGELNKGDRAKILLGLALLKDSRVVIMNDIGLAMKIDFLDYFRDSLYSLMDKKAAILYMSEDMQMIGKISDFVTVLLTDRVVRKIYEGETDLMQFDR